MIDYCMNLSENLAQEKSPRYIMELLQIRWNLFFYYPLTDQVLANSPNQGLQ